MNNMSEDGELQTTAKRYDIIKPEHVRKGFSNCVMSNFRMVPTNDYGKTTKTDKLWIDVSNGSIAYSWIPNKVSQNEIVEIFGTKKYQELEGKQIKLIVKKYENYPNEMIFPEKV